MLEAVAKVPNKRRTGKSVLSRGYNSSPIPDLMVDYRLDSEHPFAWISYSFEKTYPVIIWGVKLMMNNELFDVPQANLTAVPLHEAFSWAYAHFILEDQTALLRPQKLPEPRSLTGQVLRYAAIAA